MTLPPNFETMDDFLSRLPIEEQAEIWAGVERMRRSAIQRMPFQTQRPLGLQSFLYKSEEEEFEIRWLANFKTKTLLIFTPQFWPSSMLNFLTQLPSLDRRFAEAGISIALDINAYFSIKVCQEIEDRERWLSIRVVQYGSRLDIDVDTLPWRRNSAEFSDSPVSGSLAQPKL